jgi:hypothetical protein
METKFTPGPWKLSLPDETAVSSFDGTEIAAVQGDYDDDDVWPVMAANARLVAAAPDLLEALKALIAVSTNTQAEADWSREWCAALDAIAKAEGR